ncbi:MAG: arylsulfatase [Bacteroidales bacterium]|nr:arylsulfatase [Bacteroidales bacterium]
MKNRVLISIGFILFSIAIIGCSNSDKNKQENIPPNIVFIMADDLGYGELGCFGQEKIITSNIDALASEGMKFTQFYSGAPVCAPARCILLTGKHSGNAFIRGNNEWPERGEVWNFEKASKDPGLEGQYPIPAETITMGKLLQGAGYKTACIGKWGLGAPNSEGVPNKQGFDFFFGYNCQRQAHTYYPLHLWRNEEKVFLDNELVVPGTKLEKGADPNNPASYKKFFQNDYSADLMLDEALNFMDENKNQPFFLYYASPIPHDPVQVPKEYVDWYQESFGEEEPYLGDKGYFPNQYPRAAYAGMINYLDDQVGKLVAKLKELGLYENTLIIFTSDNGPTYAGGVDAAFFDSAKPFKSEHGWGKGFTHEGGIRVPMIASWPGHIEQGTENNHISAFWDVLPTFCEITNIPVPEDIDGISFLPALSSMNQENHDYLYWEFPSYTGQQAVRIGKWKGIRQNIFKGNMDIELYNLENDIREENNIALEHPEIVKQIEEIMLIEHEPSEMFPLFPSERNKE